MSSKKSPTSPHLAPRTAALLSWSSPPTPESVHSNHSPEEEVIFESESVEGVPRSANLFRAPLEGPLDSYSKSNARARRIGLWRARSPMRVNISPRAQWSSSSERRRRGTKKFPAARMNPWPRTLPMRGMVPLLPPHPGQAIINVPRREFRPMNVVERAQGDAALLGIEEMLGRSRSSPGVQATVIRRRFRNPGSPRSRSGSRSRSSSSRRRDRRLMVNIRPRARSVGATRRGIPRIAPPPKGARRTLRRNMGFRNPDQDRENRKHWKETRKMLRENGYNFPSSPSSSSSK